MRSIEVALLSYEDVVSLEVGMGTVIALVEKAFLEHGRGAVENPPKPGIHARPDTFIHAMPAYFQNLDIGGLKWVAGYPSNRDRGLPQILGMIVLNDMQTGVPVCVMDGTWITAVRTAAASAVAAKYLAAEGAHRMGVVGAGVQGYFHILAIREVLPELRQVAVCDIKAEKAKALAERVSADLELETDDSPDVRRVVEDADVVVTATQRVDKPLIRGEWLKRGCLGLPLEIGRAWDRAAFSSVDLFVTDDLRQAEYLQEQGAFPHGFPADGIELGRIVAADHPGRPGNDSRILAVNTGLAMSDIILANHLYRLASERGASRTFKMMESSQVA